MISNNWCCFRMRFRWARLRNWRTGPTVAFGPNSTVIQYILDAYWYNWSSAHRFSITCDVEASNVIWVTPTRLGVWLQYPIRINRRKATARIHICLYDRRIIKANIFRLQTYQQWFKHFLSNLNNDVSARIIFVN